MHHTTQIKKFMSRKSNFKKINILIKDSILSLALLTFMETAVWPFKAGSLRSPTIQLSNKSSHTRAIKDSINLSILQVKTIFLITTKNVNSRQFFGVCVTPGCVTIIQRAFYAKTSKMNCPFTSLGELLFSYPSWIFHVLYYNSRALLRYNDSYKIHVPSRDFFL